MSQEIHYGTGKKKKISKHDIIGDRDIMQS